MKKPSGSPRFAARRRTQLGVLGATVLGVAAFAGPAQATPGIGLHAPVQPAADLPEAGGFPAYFQDSDGMQLKLCLLEPSCIAAAPIPGVWDPAQPPVVAALAADSNFPDELFWWESEATAVTGNGGNVLLIMGQEAAFANGEAIDGDQGGFGRVRIRARATDGLAANTWYRFTYPFGQVELQSDGGGVINSTDDVGCPIGPCGDPQWDTLANSQVGPRFLQWDTGQSDPPAGTVGDGAIGTLHRVVGSTFVPAGQTTPANYFKVERLTGPGGNVVSVAAETDQFTVQGVLADGADPSGVLVGSDGAFANQRVNTSGAKTITLRNGGSGPVVLQSLAMTGAAAGQFALGAGCNGGNITLNPGGSCTVPVTFTPNGTGLREAQISATEQTPVGVQTRAINLLGTGILPELSVPAAPVAYGNQLVGTLIGPRGVVVSNTGTDTLHVGTATFGGTSPGQYTFGLNTCTGANLAPGGSCTVEVFFRPTALGAQSALLNVSSDVGTKSVALSGTGVGTPGEVTQGGGGAAATGTPALSAPLVVPVAGSSLAKLSLTSLSGPIKVKRSKATKSGIRLTVRVKPGTKTLQIKVYRKTGSVRRLVSSGFKSVGSGSLLRVTQSHATLRRAFRVLGRYEVEVTPGRSTTDLGTTKKLAFRVVR
jgi:hypothetical protein